MAAIVLRHAGMPWTYDVFAGIGWPQRDAVVGATNALWSRVRKNSWGIQVLSGYPLSKDDCKQLLPIIEANPRGSFEPLALGE